MSLTRDLHAALRTVKDGETASSTAGSKNLTTKSYPQLIEMLQRENYLFENKNLLKRLPDGGERIKEKISKIFAELESREPNKIEGQENRRLIDLVDTRDFLKQMKNLIIGPESGSKPNKPMLKRLPSGGEEIKLKICGVVTEHESPGPSKNEGQENVDTRDLLKQMKKLIIEVESESKPSKPVLDSDDDTETEDEDTETEDEEDEGEKSEKSSRVPLINLN